MNGPAASTSSTAPQLIYANELPATTAVGATGAIKNPRSGPPVTSASGGGGGSDRSDSPMQVGVCVQQSPVASH